MTKKSLNLIGINRQFRQIMATWQDTKHMYNLVFPRPTQPSISLGSVNEYQLQLGRQRKIWFIPLADERGVCR